MQRNRRILLSLHINRVAIIPNCPSKHTSTTTEIDSKSKCTNYLYTWSKIPELSMSRSYVRMRWLKYRRPTVNRELSVGDVVSRLGGLLRG
jgi:hypothetical protein